MQRTAGATQLLASTLSPLLLLLLHAQGAAAGNPLVPNVGMADPHLHREPDGDGFLLFATHDFSWANTGFLMKDWHLYHSLDLVDWSLITVLDPTATVPWGGEPDECWATDGAFHDNAWYWYLSVGPDQVGVVRSNVSNIRAAAGGAPASPAVDALLGPWEDPLGKALLSPALAKNLTPTTTFRDPAVFQDPSSGASYIISGVFTYYMARLDDNMVSLAETPRLVVVDPNGHDAWGPYGQKTDDKPCLHFANGLYYLSWGAFYGTSNSSVYGPYHYQGSVINTTALAPDFRVPGDPTKPWYGQPDQQDRHGNFLVPPAHATILEQVIFSANDRSHYNGTDPSKAAVYRNSVLGYVHYRTDGTISPVVIDAQGVNAHDATRGRTVQAETFQRVVDVDVAPSRTTKVWLGAGEFYQTADGATGENYALQLTSGATVEFRRVRLPVSRALVQLRLRQRGVAAGRMTVGVSVSARGTAGVSAAASNATCQVHVAAAADVSSPPLSFGAWTELLCELPVASSVLGDDVTATTAPEVDLSFQFTWQGRSAHINSSSHVTGELVAGGAVQFDSFRVVQSA